MPEGEDTALSPAEGGERTHHICWGEIQVTSCRGVTESHSLSEGRGRSPLAFPGQEQAVGRCRGLRPGSSSRQSLDEALRDLSAAMHRDLSEKQALCYALSFPPTKLELCTTRPEGTDSFIFEFPHPDARLGFEQVFDEAKRKLGKPGPCWCPPSSTSRQWAAPCGGL